MSPANAGPEGAGTGRIYSLRIPRWSLVFVVVGIAAVVASGSLAAGTASDPTEFTVWASAYLGLVVGVVQAALGLGAGALAVRRVTPTIVASGFAAFNVGNALVITGTGIDGAVGWNVVLVDVGGLMLIPAMVLFIYMVRGARPSAWLHVYRLVALVILISMPIGLFLARG